MKYLLIGALFLFPTLAFAQTFDTNLSYGSTGTEVSALQEFLVTQHVLAPQYITGNFYSLTLAAVKAFQTAESITPVSGYFGPISRATANAILVAEAPQSEENAATTTEPVDLSQSTTTPAYTPPQVIYVPVQTPPVSQSNNQTFGDTQQTVPAPTCTVAMGVNIEPSSFVMDNVASIVQWSSTNAISGSISIGGHTWNLSPVSGGTMSDITIHQTDQPYIASFVGTNGDNITCSPQFTPSMVGQMVTLTQNYNAQMQTFQQNMNTVQSQADAQIAAFNNSGGEIGFVTGEIAQVNATEETQVEAIETQETTATATYNSQIIALSAIQ